MSTDCPLHPHIKMANQFGSISAVIGRQIIPPSHRVMSHFSPIDLSPLQPVSATEVADYDRVCARLSAAFLSFRQVPAPRRGLLIKCFSEKVTCHKEVLAELIIREVGKIRSEALGEVQEIIDICDFAVGLSRQLHGLTIASERPSHRMMEQWHPLGMVGVITAFNFPMAVWAWNACLALVCGNAVLWKPSEQAPNCALALHQLMLESLQEFEDIPDDIVGVVFGDRLLGQRIAEDHRVALVSATGSCAMGRDVAARVAARLGKSLLELGGNNALICTPSADLDLALRAIVFSAAGTAGQRCTSLRRLIVHESLRDTLLDRLQAAFASIRVGDPRQSDVLMGPLISEKAFQQMQAVLSQAQTQGATLVSGGERVTANVPGGFYVTPALVSCPSQIEAMRQETFAPILYVVPYRTLDEAIALNNEVAQGLSSAIFTNDIREGEYFLSACGSDCGIANVNIGTSGAEIGGAFGGEKDTGGGRESGSDAWKNYMRRATNTINYGNTLPLAQGIRFELG